MGRGLPAPSGEVPRNAASLFAIALYLLVCSPFVYMTLYFWESGERPAVTIQPRSRDSPNRAISQYHTFFIMALYCSDQYAQYMLNVY